MRHHLGRRCTCCVGQITAMMALALGIGQNVFARSGTIQGKVADGQGSLVVGALVTVDQSGPGRQHRDAGCTRSVA